MGVIPKSLPVLLTELILRKMAVNQELQLSTELKLKVILVILAVDRDYKAVDKLR